MSVTCGSEIIRGDGEAEWKTIYTRQSERAYRAGRPNACCLTAFLGDRRSTDGNVRPHAVPQAINEVFQLEGAKVVYGEMFRLRVSSLASEGSTFRQIPKYVKIR